MYSIKPWGKACIVGQSTTALAIGIGMRWRETCVQMIERQPNPDFELSQFRRCILSQNGVRLLTDLGVSKGSLERCIRPAGKWLFLNQDLQTIREGDQYPGCAPLEAVFQCTEGELSRVLRREFLRYGGYITWGTEAHEMYPVGDDEGLWAMNRDYGKAHGLEAIVCASRHPGAIDALYGKEELDSIPFLRFNMTVGFAHTAPDAILELFGRDKDYLVALGRGFAMHLYRPWIDKKVVSWRITQPPGTSRVDDTQSPTDEATKYNRDEMHPLLRRLVSVSNSVLHDEVRLPSRPAAVQADARTARVTVVGDALYPVDTFELRGDRALVGIEDASAFIRRLYSQRYHRGFAPMDMREHEMDTVTKRAQLLQRDVHDIETFLESMRELPSDAKTRPEPPKPIPGKEKQNGGSERAEDDGEGGAKAPA